MNQPNIDRETNPACHYLVVAFAGDFVSCADYATFGTDKLSDNITRQVRGGNQND